MMGLGTGRGQSRMTDLRETVCTICRCGIFRGQPRIFSRNPLGLIHEACADHPPQMGEPGGPRSLCGQSVCPGCAKDGDST